MMWRRLKTFVGHRDACRCVSVIIAIAALVSSPADAAPIAVRFAEGVTHGYLLVRSLAGKTIAQGELIQVVKEGGLVESQLIFHFKDGSLHDEKVTFSQQQVFTLIRYHLVQRGPSFPDQLDVSIDRGKAEYKVRSKAVEDGKEEVLTGEVDLPKDVYNGMLTMLSKNLRRGADEMVSVLVFSPGPQVIKVQLLAMDEQTVHIGDQSSKAKQYFFKPQIGMIRGWLGKVTGKLPDQFHYECWILDDEAPTFLQFVGPLQLMGPIWRIELVNPRLSAKPEDLKISSK